MKYIFIVLFIMLLTGCDRNSSVSSNSNGISITSSMGSKPDVGFERALQPREFEFPADHFAHPAFATEWWYFTGNLESADGYDFGYQLTLFRVGVKPGQTVDDSNWRANQIYMGHLAISDLANKSHISTERFARSAAGLAGADQHSLRIWLGDWSVTGIDNDFFPLHLQAGTKDIAIDLTLQSGFKPRVLQGDKGYSRKGAEPGNASFYYSYTRLPTQGTLRIADKKFMVEGNSWFDREWSSSALAEDQQGWDWFSLQLEDGRDLMFYRLRDKQGRAQTFSNGILLQTDGTLQSLSLQDVQVKPVKFWQSPQQVTYPTAWSLKIPQHEIDLQIAAAFEDQEMKHTVHYWEGAVVVSGSHNGVGYMELSGYAH